MAKRAAVTVTVTATGEEIKLTREMVVDVLCNPDGTSTVVTVSEGSIIVNEDCEWLKDIVLNQLF